MELPNLLDAHFCVNLTDETGKGTTEVFRVFPGIYLMYNDFYMDHCQNSVEPMGEFWGIEHCRAGKTEWKLENGDYAYLGADTLMSCDYEACGRPFSFPGRLFEGLTLGFDLPLGETSLLETLGLDFMGLKEKISAVGLVDVAGDPEADAVLKLLYGARYKTDLHRKLALSQFLVYLSDLEPNRLEPLYMRKYAVDRIKDMECFLREHLDRRWTLAELSDRFQIPVSVLRRNFTGVFGVSVAEHMRRVRAEKAKEMLLNTSKSIGEIASELGYDNASKFSAAFRSYAELSPRMYRSKIDGNTEPNSNLE